MPVNRTGWRLKAAITASVGTASCICAPSIRAGISGKRSMSCQAAASGWVKSAGATPSRTSPPVSRAAAHR